ncbi:hypothetical protein, partial [Vibrio sp. D54]|uniref:hypothetical protein n=1 Tax=Vibrio sp. D54 TaxID=2912256 RepID=UPI001F302AFC
MAPPKTTSGKKKAQREAEDEMLRMLAAQVGWVQQEGNDALNPDGSSGPSVAPSGEIPAPPFVSSGDDVDLFST